MERETLQVTTPVTKMVVELKKWITAKERRDITKVLFVGMEYTSDMKVKPKLDGETINKSQDATIKAIVVSVKNEDGKLEAEPLSAVLDLPTEDFDFVINEINKITGTGEEVVKK